MTIPPLDPETFLDLAAELRFELPDVDVNAWAGCAEARLRSSVSRAYYAVFLALKKALIDSGHLTAPFPEGDAHGKVYRAVSGALGEHHRLTRDLKVLRSERGHTDYVLDMPIDVDYVEARLEEAERALGSIRNKKVDLARIANRLY